jgi:hypothetical protein
MSDRFDLAKGTGQSIEEHKQCLRMVPDLQGDR